MNGSKVVNEEPKDERDIIGVVLGLGTWRKLVRGVGGISPRQVEPVAWVVKEEEVINKND